MHDASKPDVAAAADALLHPGISHRWYLALSALARKVALLAPECSGTVVDYGCGTKPYRPLFTAAARYVGVDFVARDPSDLALRPDFGLPLEDGAADAVVSSQVLEHVADTGFYLSECRRVLRPRGRLLLSTHGIWVYHTADAEDYRRWTHTGLAHELTKNGFRVLRVEKACEGWACIAQQFINAVAYDKSGFGLTRRVAFALFCAAVNSTTVVLMKLAPTRHAAGPTLPVNYVVLAERD